MMEWNEQNLETLGGYIDQGLSSAQAAAKFGVTRDSVIGAAHRRGWNFGRPRSAVPMGGQRAVVNTERPHFPVEALACITDVDELAVALLMEYRIKQNALPKMVERVLADPDMRDEVLARVIEAQCSRILEAAVNEKHQAEKRRTGGGPIGRLRANNAENHAAAVADALMDTFKLPGGVKLGDATRKDLTTALASYEMQTADLSIKHRWLRLVQQSVPEGRRVRDVLTEERVAELRAEARRSDA